MSSTDKPEFTVKLWCRKSRKAHSISIRTLPPYGVEIVLPESTNDNFVKKIIGQNQAYINRKLSQIEKRNLDIKPLTIFFPVTNEHINIVYLKSASIDKPLEVVDGTLTLNEPTGMESLIDNSKLLQVWLQKRATCILKDILDTTAQKLNISYNKIKVGPRKSIWGSCSYKQNINLNRNLIFLKSDLIEYVITHELCHVFEMNHSPNFWSLLNEMFPNYRKIKGQLRSNANSSIPSWALV